MRELMADSQSLIAPRYPAFSALPPAQQRRSPLAPNHAPSYMRRVLPFAKRITMKVANSLRSLKNRHKDCQIVRRRGRVYVINKTNPRFKARQGKCKKK